MYHCYHLNKQLVLLSPHCADTVLNDFQVLPHLILKLMPYGNSDIDFSRGWKEGARDLIQDTEASYTPSPSENSASRVRRPQYL